MHWVWSIVAVALATRVIGLLVGAAGVATIGPAPSTPPPATSSILADLPNRWDAGWYVGIASGGYRFRGTREARSDRLAFFPAYPVALRLTARALRIARTPSAWSWVGVALSTVAFICAAVYLFLLAAHWSTPERGFAAVLLLCTYPYAVFYSAAYTESFFLLGATGAFWHFGRAEFGRAFAWGLLTGLTRPNGFLLAVCLAVWALQAPSVCLRYGRRSAGLAAVLAPVLGMSIYAAYVWTLTGDPVAWVSAQQTWGRQYVGLTGALVDVAGRIGTEGFLAFAKKSPFDLANGIALVAVLAGVIPAGRILGLPAASFMVLNVLPALIVGGLPSMGRYTSVAFPLFIWLAAVLPTRYVPTVAVPCALAQGLVAVLHYTSRPLY